MPSSEATGGRRYAVSKFRKAVTIKITIKESRKVENKRCNVAVEYEKLKTVKKQNRTRCNEMFYISPCLMKICEWNHPHVRGTPCKDNTQGGERKLAEMTQGTQLQGDCFTYR